MKFATCGLRWSSRLLMAGLGALCALLWATAGLAQNPGALDKTFASEGSRIYSLTPGDDQLRVIAAQSDGKILLAGLCHGAGLDINDVCVLRLTKSGEPDTTFGTNGVVVSSAFINTYTVVMTVQEDQKIVVAGTCTPGAEAVCALRLQADGTLDPAFGQLGVAFGLNSFGISAKPRVTRVASLPTGDLLLIANCTVAPMTYSFCALRLTSSGTVDVSYGTNGVTLVDLTTGSDEATTISVFGDGSTVIGGVCGTVFGGDFCATKLSPTGSIDASFGIGGAARIAVQNWTVLNARLDRAPDGSLRLAGQCWSEVNQLTAICFARLNAGGAVDSSFVNGGTSSFTLGAATDMLGAGVVLSPDGAYMHWRCDTQSNDLCVAQVNEISGLVATFGVSGIARHHIGEERNWPTTIARQDDGKLLIGGRCHRTPTEWVGIPGIQPWTEFCVARLKVGPYNPQTCTLNLDANSTIDPATDALLVTRYLLGFRGDALTTGAVGASATRTNAEIETYLGALMQAGKLDVDGDGQSLAMTDGLLLIRAMLGLSGTALTNAATNAAYSNVRNAQQVLSWIESTHGLACLP